MEFNVIQLTDRDDISDGYNIHKYCMFMPKPMRMLLGFTVKTVLVLQSLQKTLTAKQL